MVTCQELMKNIFSILYSRLSPGIQSIFDNIKKNLTKFHINSLWTINIRKPLKILDIQGFWCSRGLPDTAPSLDQHLCNCIRISIQIPDTSDVWKLTITGFRINCPAGNSAFRDKDTGASYPGANDCRRQSQLVKYTGLVALLLKYIFVPYSFLL